MSHSLGRMTSTEAAQAPRGLLVPLGATEQHGPHLNLNTDSAIAVAWAESVAEHCPGWVVAPLLPYGSSGEHQSFAGTLSIGAEALRYVVVELVRSASIHFDSIVLLCGHGGNFGPVSESVKQLRHEGHNVQWLFPSWPDRTGIDAHAGCTETSIMLHLESETVRSETIVVGQTKSLAELMPVMTKDGVAPVSDTGVLGDPTKATAELGQLLFDDLVARTVKKLG